MAKSGTAGRQPKPPSLSGRVIQYTYRGQLVSRKWPRKRGKNIHPTNRAWANWFAEANRAVKADWPSIQAEAIEATHDTPLMPRDPLIMIMSGRLWTYQSPDGRLWPHMSQRTDASIFLDMLSQVRGSLLYKGETYWEALGPGTPGQFLRIDPSTELPSWIDVPSNALACRVFLNDPVSLFAGITKKIPWEGALFDEAGIWDAAQPTRLTVPAGVSKAQVVFGGILGSSQAGNIDIRIRYSGAGTPARAFQDTNGFIAWSMPLGPYPVTPGEYFEAELNNSSGNTLQSFESTFFSMRVEP